MGSKKEIIAAIDAVGVAYDSLLALPLHTLTRSERVSLLQRMDESGGCQVLTGGCLAGSSAKRRLPS